MAASDAGWKSRPQPRSGITAGWHRCRSAGCWCATPPASVSRSLCTDLDATPAAILGWFVCRWSMETTFQETRQHLGVETSGSGSDLAIARTTPALLGLFSLITLWAAEAKIAAMLHPRSAAWSAKDDLTFSDAIAAVRRVLWGVPNLSISRKNPEMVEIPAALLQGLTEAVCYAT